MAGAAAIAASRAVASETLTKIEALSGDRFRAGAREFSLSDIAAPSPYDLRRAHEPYFKDAREVLETLIRDNAVTLLAEGGPDRWGVTPVVAKLAGDALTLQERVVAQGAARVDPQTDDHVLIDRLLHLEDEARKERRGLWRLDDYRVFDAANAWGAVDGFNLVEGRVEAAAERKGRVYLNFGADYREDFTVTATAGRARRWRAGGLDLLEIGALGARLRARGFVKPINGPSIELRHPKQLEALSPPRS
ncbi:MAG: thermonuclease family protein [Pseudomonadota bacterium]